MLRPAHHEIRPCIIGRACRHAIEGGIRRREGARVASYRWVSSRFYVVGSRRKRRNRWDGWENESRMAWEKGRVRQCSGGMGSLRPRTTTRFIRSARARSDRTVSSRLVTIIWMLLSVQRLLFLCSLCPWLPFSFAHPVPHRRCLLR